MGKMFKDIQRRVDAERREKTQEECNALEAEVRRLREAVVFTKNGRLRQAVVDQLLQERDILTECLDKIRGDRDRLRAILRSVAHLEVADHYPNDLPVGLLIGAESYHPHVTIGDLREAKAAYWSSVNDDT